MKEGLELVAAPDVALVQLCDADVSIVRPLLPAEAVRATICADEGVSCVGGIVQTCVARGQPARLITACASGCAAGVSLDPGDLVTSDGPAAILCRRAHAERR